MELLPIIYWALIGVGILALIVIIFSFITFQIRKRLGTIPNEEIIGDERNKKIIVTNPDKKSSSVKSAPKKPHHPKVKTRKKKVPVEGTRASVPTPSNKNEIAVLYKKPSKDKKKSRIEIVNSPQSRVTKKFHSMDVSSKRKGWN